jgi:UDP-3-O-acyl-N-acetylglucosamine deacetylase
MCIKEIFSKKFMKIANNTKLRMQTILNGLKTLDAAGDLKMQTLPLL